MRAEQPGPNGYKLEQPCTERTSCCCPDDDSNSDKHKYEEHAMCSYFLITSKDNTMNMNHVAHILLCYF